MKGIWGIFTVGKHIWMPKFYVFLLIFLCAILAQTSYAIPVTSSEQRLILHTSQFRELHHQHLLEQHRSAHPPPPPTPHRHHLQHRSVNTMPENGIAAASAVAAANGNNYNGNNNNGNNANYNGNEYCQMVTRTLKRTQKQANATFNTIRAILDDYTKYQFNKTPEELHEEWQKHLLQLEHPYSQRLVRDFDVMPDESHFKHLVGPISRQTLMDEMQNVYLTLSILEGVFKEVIANRLQNRDRLLHDLNYKHDVFEQINGFFAEAHRHVRIDLQEVDEAMRGMNITKPQVSKLELSYNRDAPVRDWLLAKEHLSVVQYLRALYTILLTRCPQ